VSRERFSSRHGFEPKEVEIKVRHEAPVELRAILVDLAYEAGLDPHSLRGIVCKVLRVREDPSNWSAFPNVDGEARNHLDSCEWYEVYDVIEAIHESLQRRDERSDWEKDETPAEYFDTELNKYFRKKGIGWQLKGGVVEVRGTELFETVISASRKVLAGTGRGTAEKEIHEALHDLSRRPEPDLTGALQHALAALECVARDVTGERKPTLGQLLAKNPGLMPPPLDKAVEKMWGFASEQGRHLREGEDPGETEVELAVVVAAAMATYLVRKQAEHSTGA
jgi:hypothetical protein